MGAPDANKVLVVVATHWEGVPEQVRRQGSIFPLRIKETRGGISHATSCVFSVLNETIE